MDIPEEHPPHRYPVESAGRLMIRSVPVAHTTDTISDAEQRIIKKANSFESMSYIYVVDGDGVLKGVLSIKEIFRASGSVQIRDVMVTDLVTTRARTDQEQVALLALRHSIKAVPVVKKDGVLLGVVPTDAILNVLHSESVEDALRLAGAGKLADPAVDIITASTWLHFSKRLPWLILGLGGGIAAAFVVRHFEDALANQVILAAFIPAVVYMADAVGAQTQTIFIRSLALTRKLDMVAYIFRELKVAFLLALVLGSLAFASVAFWVDSVVVGAVFGVSITATILAAMVVALGLPWLLMKSRYDPAIASGPFATVIRDISSLLIYFSIASAVF